MASTRPKSKALPSSNGWADSAEQWRERNRHQVVMPSGAKAVIALVELMPLVLANLVPDDLAELARKELTDDLGAIGGYAREITGLDPEKPEDVEKAKTATERFSHLLKWLVAEHVLLEPKVRLEDLNDYPTEDLDWLFGVATRRVFEDALGRRLGVAPLSDFARFRHFHECPEDCAHCAALLDDRSTADLGAL